MMGREWRWTKMEIENHISSLYQSTVSDRDGNGDAKWGWGSDCSSNSLNFVTFGRKSPKGS